MKNHELGKWIGGNTAIIDIDRLMETRLLIQANSGGGKSWLLRKLLEVTAGKVQQFIIDPEGEFASLREKYDLIVAAATGGDALAHPKTAKLLAIRLLETGASAVLDLYELKAHERHQFVQLFLEALMNAPKTLWRPVLVAVDESHLFCPEKGQGESQATEAMIDLATRGRKRGFAMVAATQRIGKFHKSAAAELKNKLIGSTGLDVDVKRAAFELGLTPKEALAALRALKSGHFFGFGPALEQVDPRELVVGKVVTTHPQAGSHKFAPPPPPTAAIRALMPKLADLPKEAEEEARTVDELRRENAKLRRELDAKPAPGASPEELRAAESRGTQAGITVGLCRAFTEIEALAERMTKALPPIEARPENPGRIETRQLPGGMQQSRTVAHVDKTRAWSARTVARARLKDGGASTGGEKLSKAERKVLTALAQYPEGRTKTQVAVLGAYAVTGGGFNNALGSLRSKGFIEGTGERLVITDAGVSALGPYEPLPTGAALLEHWLPQLSKAERAALEVLARVYPKAMAKEDLATIAGYEPSGGGFNNALGRLRTLELISGRGELKASEDLF